MARLNFVNSILLVSIRLINNALILSGNSAFYWSEEFQSVNLYAMNRCVTFPHGVSLVYCVLLNLYGFWQSYLNGTILIALTILLLQWLLVTETLRSAVFEIVEAVKLAREVLVIENLFRWTHVLEHTFNLLTAFSTWPFIGYVTHTNWIAVFIVLHFWVVPNLIISAMYLGFLTAQVLFERTNEKLTEYMARTKEVPFEVNERSLKEFSRRIERMLSVHLKIRRSVDAFGRSCQMWILMYFLFAIKSVRLVGRSWLPDLASAVGMVMQFCQLLQFGATVDGWRAETRRILEVIPTKYLNLLQAIDRNIEMIALMALSQEEGMKLFGMFEFNKKFVCKFYVVLLGYVWFQYKTNKTD